MKCLECGQEGMQEGVENVDYLSLPGIVLQRVSVYHCPYCGSKEIAIPRISKLNNLLADYLENKTALTEAEIVFLRKEGRDVSGQMKIKNNGTPSIVQPSWRADTKSWALVTVDRLK